MAGLNPGAGAGWHAAWGAADGRLASSAEAFLGAAIGTPVAERGGVGVGVYVDVANPLLAGSGLTLERELLQLSVFATDSPRARIRRPSQRR